MDSGRLSKKRDRDGNNLPDDGSDILRFEEETKVEPMGTRFKVRLLPLEDVPILTPELCIMASGISISTLPQIGLPLAPPGENIRKEITKDKVWRYMSGNSLIDDEDGQLRRLLHAYQTGAGTVLTEGESHMFLPRYQRRDDGLLVGRNFIGYDWAFQENLFKCWGALGLNLEVVTLSLVKELGSAGRSIHTSKPATRDEALQLLEQAVGSPDQEGRCEAIIELANHAKGPIRSLGQTALSLFLKDVTTLDFLDNYAGKLGADSIGSILGSLGVGLPLPKLPGHYVNKAGEKLVSVRVEDVKDDEFVLTNPKSLTSVSLKELSFESLVFAVPERGLYFRTSRTGGKVELTRIKNAPTETGEVLKKLTRIMKEKEAGSLVVAEPIPVVPSSEALKLNVF